MNNASSSSAVQPRHDQQSSAPHIYRDEVTLRDLFGPLKRGFLIIPVVIVACLALAAIYAKRQPVLYAVDMSVLPIKQQSTTSTGGNSSMQLIGNLLGDSGAASQEFELFQATLGSVPLARRLQEKHQLLQRLNATRWDEETQSWKAPELGRRARLEKAFLAWFGIPYVTEPSLRSLAGTIKGMFTIEPIEDTPLHRISMLTQTPEEGVALMSLIYQETDALLRAKRSRELKQQLEFLVDRLSKTSNLSHRDALTSMVSKVTMDLTLNEVGTPYAAEIINPPSMDPVPASPKLGLIFAAAGLLGVTLGVMLAYIVGMIRGRRKA